MSSDIVPESLQRIWSAWNIRGFIIFAESDFKQILDYRCVVSLLARRLDDGVCLWPHHEYHIPELPGTVVSGLALWAAYLLVHLGGPDSITAFSLEDNALWPRHLVGLFAQVSAFLYIFAKTISGGNKLLVPTITVFVSGFITYGERSRSLYLASLERLKKSGEEQILLLKPSDVHSSWSSAYQLSQTLKGLVVDISPSKDKLRESREFFLKEEAETALEVLTKEMSFLYDMLYTKTLALRSSWGRFSRNISSIILSTATIWFTGLVIHDRHQSDYIITSILVYEAFVLQMLSDVMLRHPLWKPENFSGSLLVVLRNPKKLRSETMGTRKVITRREGHLCRIVFGLIAKKIGAAEVIAEFKHVSKIPFDTHLWKFVFDKLKIPLNTDPDSLEIDPVIAREIYEARGNLAVGRANSEDLMRFINYFECDSTVLMWHFATLICFHLDEAYNEDETENRKFSEVISNYMVYLMVKRQKLMSPVIGIGYDRYRDTCEEMKLHGSSLNPMDLKEFCVKLLERNVDNGEPSERDKSVLRDSINLARILLNKDMKWMIISEVWVEMLSYAASHCRGESYARLLAEGGEFISFVWLVMSHLGIGPRVPVQ